MPTTISKGLGLFLQAIEPNVLDDSLDLALCGSVGHSGVFHGATLFIGALNVPTGALPLTMVASTIGYTVRNVNMWVEGELPSIADGTDLVLFNSQSGVADDTTLFIQGDGVTPEAMPCSESMLLFIQRPTTNGMTLVINGPGTPIDDDISLFVGGAFGVSSGVPLSIPNVLGEVDENITLYTRGF